MFYDSWYNNSKFYVFLKHLFMNNLVVALIVQRCQHHLFAVCNIFKRLPSHILIHCILSKGPLNNPRNIFYACHHQFASETISCKIQVIKIGHDHLQIICLGMMTKHFQVKKKNMTKNYVTYDSVVNTRKPFINSMTGFVLFDISRIQYNSCMMFI